MIIESTTNTRMIRRSPPQQHNTVQVSTPYTKRSIINVALVWPCAGIVLLLCEHKVKVTHLDTYRGSRSYACGGRSVIWEVRWEEGGGGCWAGRRGVYVRRCCVVGWFFWGRRAESVSATRLAKSLAPNAIRNDVVSYKIVMMLSDQWFVCVFECVR